MCIKVGWRNNPILWCTVEKTSKKHLHLHFSNRDGGTSILNAFSHSFYQSSSKNWKVCLFAVSSIWRNRACAINSWNFVLFQQSSCYVTLPIQAGLYPEFRTSFLSGKYCTNRKHVDLKMCAGFHRLFVTDTSFQFDVNSTDPLLCDFLRECYNDIVTLMGLH